MTNPDGAPHELRNMINRRSMFKYLAVTGGAAALGLVASCSADHSGQGGTSTSGAASGTGGGSGASSPAASSGQTTGSGAPSHGGSLTVGIGSSLADFDPYNHLAVNFPMMASLYSYLITYDDKYQPSPDLATAWKMADDKQSADITLRETTFHDGSPVTADDVVKGIERALDPKLGISETATASIIKKATASSNNVVHLEFVAPTAESRFLDFMYWFPVIQGSKNSAEALQKAPAGSGPFMLDSYSPGVSLTMKRNPHYYQSGEPYLDQLTVRFFDNNDAVVTALRGRSIAGALALDARFNSELKDDYTVVQGAQGGLIDLFRMNPLTPPFDNKMVRQAIARAIDRDRIIKQVQGGVGQPVYTSFPPNNPAFSEDDMKKVAFDLDAAKQLLTQSGGKMSGTVDVASSDAAATNALLIIKEDLGTIGFELTLNTMDQTTVNSNYLAGKEQSVVRASSNAYASPVGITQDSGFRLANNALWKDELPADYKDAIAALEAAATDDEVRTATDKLNAVLIDEAWVAGMYTLITLDVFDKTVTGYERTPANHPVFAKVQVS